MYLKNINRYFFLYYLACIGTPIGNLTIEMVIAEVGCPGKTIKEFTTSSPTGLIKTAIENPSTGSFFC